MEVDSMKKIILLGSTGSIGTQTLDVIRQYSDKLSVLGLCCDKNIDLLYEQIKEFKPQYIAVKYEQKAQQLSDRIGREVWSGDEGILRLASVQCDIVLNSLVGISGLEPTINAINAGNDIALANKETLVAGGDIVMPLARSKGVKILPVDSEHSAIWQCLDFDKSKKISSILLTASGGAFRDFTKEQLENAKSQDALKHPTWNMGNKVTIDSATLVNKGLEIIEAKHLFGVSADQIKVVVHPQSIVHSMISYSDGSVIAQMSYPDMKLPIQLALLYPDRGDFDFSPLSFAGLNLTFTEPDFDRFPCLKLALKCAKLGGVYPIIFNAVNEILVPLYLQNKIKFYDFSYYIERAMAELGGDEAVSSVDIVRHYDSLARNWTSEQLKEN